MIPGLGNLSINSREDLRDGKDENEILYKMCDAGYKAGNYF